MYLLVTANSMPRTRLLQTITHLISATMFPFFAPSFVALVLMGSLFQVPVAIAASPAAEEDEGQMSDFQASLVNDNDPLHPEFSMRPVNIDECQSLKTDQCKLIPGADKCPDGMGFFASCSHDAKTSEVRYFLAKFQTLNTGRALELRLKGKRELSTEMFEPAKEFLISFIIDEYRGFRFSTLSKVDLPWLTHIGMFNSQNVTIERSSLQPFKRLTMLIFSSTTFDVIEEGAFENLPHLRQIAFDNGFKGYNKKRLKDHLVMLHCDCKYQWLRDFLRKRPYLIQARKEGEIHTWGGIISHSFTLKQTYVPTDCGSDDIVGPEDQTDFSVNTAC